MNNKFDELARGLARSVTRRQALKKFGVGLAGMALALFGLQPEAQGGTKTYLPFGSLCSKNSDCCSNDCVRSHHGGSPGPIFPQFCG